MAYATITALNVYPIKSCRGLALEKATIQLTGLEGDRHWMLVNETGRCLTQRQLPNMALIVPELTDDGMLVNAPGMPVFHVPVASKGRTLPVTIIGHQCPAVDAGPMAAEWFSAFLGCAVRLVHFDSHAIRPINPQLWKGDTETHIEFSDAFPLLVISEASLKDLNTRVADPFPMDRFRANVILGNLLPYDEDRIHALVNPGVRLEMARPCTRCKVTTTNQLTAEVSSAEPLTTLKTYRWSKELHGLMFGQYAIVARGAGAQLQAGQSLKIEWK